ncbi:MAG: nucleotidyltransferase family protein [Elusimicrobia bacterium]|nr:nucleotidyltransferase family protein [Elusimicrobiota bacterium]
MTEQVYLLAAGQGTRMGGPKAWLNHRGKTLLRLQTQFLLKHFAPQGIFITIQGEWLKRCQAIHGGIRWIAVNPAAFPLGALMDLVRSNDRKHWAFLYHVDMPVWKYELFKSLKDQIGPNEEAIAPAYQGRQGHPILLSPQIQQKILTLNPDRDRLDWWLKNRRIKIVETPDSCMLNNWNAPNDHKIQRMDTQKR